MNLVIPVPGNDPGPDWANNLNISLTTIDLHDHSTGKGVQVTPSGLNINADLPFNNYNITLPKTVRFTAQVSALSAVSPNLNCLYVAGVDLYYNDGNGNQIRITQTGSVTGSSGTITGLPSGTASAAYSAGTFTFQSATLTSANIDAGSYVLRNNTASSFGLTLQPPTLASNYSLTLPSLPAQTNVMSLTSAGVIGSITYDQVGQGMTSVGANAIGVSMNATGANAVMASVTVVPATQANLVGAAMSSSSSANNVASLTNNPNFGGNAAQENGKNLVVSSANATNSLAVIRGAVSNSGTILEGEGFTVTNGGPGSTVYTINFNNSFSDTPVAVANINTPTSAGYIVLSCDSGHIYVLGYNSSGILLGNFYFSFIVMGQR